MQRQRWIREGNSGNTVKARVRIRYDDPRIYRWICLNYTELVERVPPCVGSGKGETVFPDTQIRYGNAQSVPEYVRPTIEKLVEQGWLLGVAEDDLGLTDEMVRVLVILDRAGAFGGTDKT